MASPLTSTRKLLLAVLTSFEGKNGVSASFMTALTAMAAMVPEASTCNPVEVLGDAARTVQSAADEPDDDQLAYFADLVRSHTTGDSGAPPVTAEHAQEMEETIKRLQATNAELVEAATAAYEKLAPAPVAGWDAKTTASEALSCVAKAAEVDARHAAEARRLLDKVIGGRKAHGGASSRRRTSSVADGGPDRSAKKSKTNSGKASSPLLPPLESESKA
jgi:hypothetical protein